MNILFYFGHPAQFHFAKNIVANLKNDGHNVHILIKTKDILEDLLKESGWDYVNIQPVFRKNNKLSIAMASLQRTRMVLKYAKRYKVDLLIGTDASVAQAAWLLHKFSFTTLEDDAEIITKLVKTTYPFTTCIVVPRVCSVGKWNAKKVAYDGYMKLGYLHPNCFTPNLQTVRKYIDSGKYCLIRLAKLVAHHDEGIKGLDLTIVSQLVKLMEVYGLKVYIHSEIPLDESLEQYHLKMASADIHHVLAFASLLISDSQSMSVEAAMLGTPSIRFSDFTGKISVLEELEQKYGLTFGIKTNELQRLYDKTKELLSMNGLKEEFLERRQRMLADKIDVTAFFTWFIENYPESNNIMNDTPDYQVRFK